MKERGTKMVNQPRSIDPEKLPFQIEDEIGEILLADLPYPGVYYVAAKKAKPIP